MLDVRIKTDEGVDVPAYATDGSSGVDIAAGETVRIFSESWQKVRTGLYFEIPEGFEMQVRSRSGLASQGITIMNQPGTLDSDYRGELILIVHNHQKGSYRISKGDRIAQGVFVAVERVKFTLVDTLNDTHRGAGGLGSTGVGSTCP
ncbi:hypothetical protein LCGC14_0730910 [marine sediment metagenome]|uniref:dUTP diphosphatase n=1 Tax=marine sediment metagenome TaxID=412755 RepID=A0A0F9QUP2_9ZZZZ